VGVNEGVNPRTASFAGLEWVKAVFMGMAWNGMWQYVHAYGCLDHVTLLDERIEDCNTSRCPKSGRHRMSLLHSVPGIDCAQAAILLGSAGCTVVGLAVMVALW
jgi:hypothetical protein